MSNKNKTYKNIKKINEVKEVIQNKPDSEIFKVLDYFDNDVGKTIDAFINDDGKEALAKWNEMKSTTNKNSKLTSNNKSTLPKLNEPEENQIQQNKTDLNGKKSNNKEKNVENLKKNLPSSNPLFNINDLVSSIINQYTAVDQPIANQSTKASSNLELNNLKKNAPASSSDNQQNNDLLENLNNLVVSSQSNLVTKSVSGLKVTVLGIESNQQVKSDSNNKRNMSPVLSSSLSSSPSSASMASPMSISSNSNQRQNHASAIQSSYLNENNNFIRKTFNKSYLNQNSKALIEKPYKELQRQTNNLNKASAQFQEELNKSQIILNQTFNRLRDMLSERQNHLQLKLNNLSQETSQLINNRKFKAAELNNLSINSIHLNDEEAKKLKADINLFLSESQIDDEFSKLKLFQNENYEKICESIVSFGQIGQIKKPNVAQSNVPYSDKKKEYNSNINKVHLNGNGSAKNHSDSNKLNGNINSTKNIINDSMDHNDGDFIEVKKPQRNKNSNSSNNNNNNINGSTKYSHHNGNEVNGNEVKPNEKLNNTKANKKNFNLINNYNNIHINNRFSTNGV